MRPDAELLRKRLASAPVARLATASPVGIPHIVPVTFAVQGDTLVTAVDHKPKSSGLLKRIENIRANNHVSLLVDHYDADWTQLWWVRVDGVARLLESGSDWGTSIAWLCDKYPQYRARPPEGLVVWVDIHAISGWSYQG